MVELYTPHHRPVPDWTPPSVPGRALVLDGAFCRLEPLVAEHHAALLFSAFVGHDDVWRFMPYGPFSSSSQYHRWIRETERDDTVNFFAIKNVQSDAFEGVASFLRIAPEAGSIEVGHINFSPALQKTRAATEAIFLMMAWAFDVGYRRFEWKCDALNVGSRRAAQRLGLSYEGVFRQAAVVKGRNRDTAWFAAIDSEWPALKEAFRVWLAPSNFNHDAEQKERLSDLTRLVGVAQDPSLGG